MSTVPGDHTALLRRALEKIEQLQSNLNALKTARTEPIAIIGLGCRFPGGDGPPAFWRTLSEGADVIAPVPPDRWPTDALYNADPQAPWKTHVQGAALLDDVDGFDASFFGISPRDAMCMDPQHRLFLEVAWHAFEDAGLSMPTLAGSRTGVFAGICSNDRQNLQMADIEGLDPLYFGIGTAHNMLTGRLAYLLDLKGPNLAIDTACSSSLVAVHLACQSLRSGESDTALAAGVNLILSPFSLLLPGKMGLMATDGRSRTFDVEADGMGRGEGCGAVVLRRLSDAIAGNDRILAVIRGSAINQDGRTASLTAPNGQSQQQVITAALRNAGLEPNRVSYVETHGTATKLGDPIEVDALRAVLGTRTSNLPCGLGSVKSNIGHTEAAAGIAGLIKVVLALQHALLPPNLHFKQLNPEISLEGTRFFIPTTLQPWVADGAPRVAGVSSFGWSGTNAHVVIEEAPTLPVRAEQNEANARLLPLSAKSHAALRAVASQYLELLADPTLPTRDIIDTASARRTHFEHRLAIIANDRADLGTQLESFLQGTPHPGIITGEAPADHRRGIVFVFPGQGSQWIGMGRELLVSNPTFRNAIEQCDEAFRQHVPWSAIAVLMGTEDTPDPTSIDVIQPLLFAIQVALAAVLRAWGIEPDAVIGHSMGEIAAAHCAGALTLEDAARIICLRSQLLLSTSGRGAMLMVELSRTQAEAAIRGHEQHVSIAVCNSHRATVLSGDPGTLDTIATALQAQAVFCRRVKVDVASHSPQMDPLRPALLEALATITPNKPTIPFYSTVTGTIPDGDDLDAEYWASNLREPVLFSTSVDSLARHGHTVFIEISPHPILLPSVDECARAAGITAIAIPTLRREEPELTTLLHTLGTLYTNGCSIRWTALFPDGARAVPLPSYPFQHQRFENPVPEAFIESILAAGRADTGAPRQPRHATNDEGIVSSFYDKLVDLTSHTEDDDAHLLTWGIVPEPVEGFSWLRTIFTPSADPAHQHLLSEAQRRLRQTLFAPIDLSHVRRVLDFGCGHATDLLELAEQHPHLSLDGYTISARQASLGRDRARTRGLADRVRVYHRDSADDDFPGTYQLMLGFEVAGLIRDKDALFANIERHLAAGGALLMADFVANTVSPIEAEETSTFSSTQAEWNTLLSSHHLRLVEGVDVSPEIANCLQDPDYAGTLAKIAEENSLDELTRRSFASYENVYKALRAGLLSYVLFHIQQDPYARVEDLMAINANRLAALTTWPDLAARRTSSTDDSTNNWLHETQWRPGVLTKLANTKTSTPPGAFFLLADAGGISARVQAALESHGETCVTIAPGQDLQQRLLEHGAPLCRAVLHLRSLDAPSTQQATTPSLRASEQIVTLSALQTVQTLTNLGLRDAPRLWLITAGAQSVLPNPEPISIAQAPLWGLAGAIVHEHSELRCVRFDLSHETTAEEIAVLCDALRNDETEDQIAVRGNKRFVARLVRTPRHSQAMPFAIQSEATYLITGGLSGVGMRTAQHLVERGARHLALVSRRGAESHSDLETMRAAGAEVRVFAADVSVSHDIAAVLAEIDGSMPPLRGIIHSAVVLEDGVLLRQTAASLRAVMAPKMDGAWNLHTLTRDHRLDFFILYSSLVSMLGTPGQGNYAAANSFLDALAHQRHAEGLPGLSINWPPWTEIGQAVTADRGARIASRGLQSITPPEGMQIFDRLLGDASPQVGVMRLDLRQWRQFYPKAASVPLLAEIAHAQGTATPAGNQSIRNNDAETMANTLAALDSAERRRAALTAHVQEQLAIVLRVPPSQIDPQTPLRSLGFDSLMVVELRNRLELNLGITLSAAVVFSYPTIATLVPHLADKLHLPLDAEPTPPAKLTHDIEVEALADELLRDLEGCL